MRWCKRLAVVVLENGCSQTPAVLARPEVKQHPALADGVIPGGTALGVTGADFRVSATTGLGGVTNPAVVDHLLPVGGIRNVRGWYLRTKNRLSSHHSSGSKSSEEFHGSRVRICIE